MDTDIEKGFPFDSIEVEGVLDRLYFADDFARYFRQFIGNGVFPNPSTSLQVTSTNSMVVTVRVGSAFANGYAYVALEDIKVAVNPAHGSYNRRDIIVARLNLTERTFLTLYRPGTAASNPQAPALIRNADIHELQLAQLTVRANTQSILASDILDTRMNAALCGIVSAVVTSVDTTTLYKQYESFLNGQITLWNNIRDVQETAWATQTQAQQDQWNLWFTMIHVDLQTYSQFNFDNLATLPGVTRDTTFSGSTVTETIIITGTTTKVATRVTNLDTMIVKETVYKSDGEEILRTATITITFPTGGVKEVVTL